MNFKPGGEMDPRLIKQAGTQTCSADNITIMRGQMIRLNGLRAMITANIRQAEREKTKASLLNNLVFGLQVVKASCDVIIGVAGELVPGASKVSNVYFGIQPSAELLGTAIAGQPVTFQDGAKALTAGGAAVAERRFGTNTHYSHFIDHTKVHADIMIDAAALDVDEVFADVRDYGVVMSSWIAHATRNPAVGRLIKSGDAMIKAGSAYHEAYDQWQKHDLDATFDSGIAVSRRQLTTISAQVSELERTLIGCGAEMPTYLSPSTRLLTGNYSGATIGAAR
ncbi:hypothetical protein [uncultured Erythrobacter sp.]|uniref:hypothetical protein n=1 Tax=uncultured Erythrobacter sp. TaxID=263913 RepID=UPI00260381A5|nr:hypothetical protein [uncultured Erythrobacter sp.]